ncbi:MAG: zinc-dependent metalloprotease [Acidimicrobiia bacterium]
MTDNLFDRLSDLLKSTGPVNWRLAAELAASVAGPAEAIEPDLADEYRELLRTAHLQVADQAGLGHFPDLGAEVTDPRTFASEHVEDLSYFAQPVAQRLSTALGTTDPMAGILTPALIGVSIGIAFGASARQALGAFDAPLPLLDPEGMILIIPNVETLAAEASVDAREARMWAALHEAARASTLAIPWVRTHLLETVARYSEDLDIDPGAIVERFEHLSSPESLQEALQDPSLAGEIFGGGGDGTAAEPLRAAAAAVSGFGCYVADMAARQLVPHAAALEAAHRPAGRELPMLGIELADEPPARAFFEELARRWGDDAVVRVWRDPQSLPSVDELADPVGWAARVLLE